MKTWLVLSASTALCFAIAGPLAKLGFNNGLKSNGFTFSYMISLMIILLANFSGGPVAWYPNPRALVYGMLAGLFCAIGFKLNSDAFAIAGSSVALIIMVVGTYPALSSMISIALFKEQIMVPRFIFGIVLMSVAMYLILTSEKVTS